MPPTIGKGQYALVLSVCLSVCLSVHPSVAYIANNSRTQKPSVSKFGTKVSHLRCDSHTIFKVKRSKVRVTDGRGHTVSAEPGGVCCIYVESCDFCQSSCPSWINILATPLQVYTSDLFNTKSTKRTSRFCCNLSQMVNGTR